MKNLLGIGTSIGVLAGVWTFASTELALVTWVGFAAWALFFAAGGGKDAAVKVVASTYSGVFWAWLVFLGVTYVSASTAALSVMVALIAFAMCLQASVSVLSFIPGAFVGAAVLFGTAFDVRASLVALAIGTAFGFASELLGGRIQALVDGRGAARTTEAGQPAAV